MKKTIWNIFVIVYALLAIFITICLLSYNQYKVSELGDYSLVIIDSRDLEPTFNKGDLVITDKSYKIEKGQEVFFYNTMEAEVTINVAKVKEIQEITYGDKTYTLEGDVFIKEEDILGPSDKVTQVSKLGTILGLLMSKWGFLALIVFPSLIAFLYEVAELFSELKDNSKRKG